MISSVLRLSRYIIWRMQFKGNIFKFGVECRGGARDGPDRGATFPDGGPVVETSTYHLIFTWWAKKLHHLLYAS